MPSIEAKKLNTLIRSVLSEDRCLGDITTRSLNLGNLKVEAVIRAEECGVCAGLDIAKRVFSLVDKKISFRPLLKDGDCFKKGDCLAKINGSVSSILSCERTALNFLSQLSGIATLTSEFVRKVKPYKTKIMDTRKTTPGLRLLEKYAVRMGGGYNHRYDLAASVLIKDNHIDALKKKTQSLDLGLLIKGIRRRLRNKEIEIEVNSVREFKEVINYPPDIIMLDNMCIPQIKQCVKLRNKTHKKVQLEISGNVNLGNVKLLAGLGVDRISIGRLTHSPKAIDVSLEFVA